jgi:hypothetical protein
MENWLGVVDVARETVKTRGKDGAEWMVLGWALTVVEGDGETEEEEIEEEKEEIKEEWWNKVG